MHSVICSGLGSLVCFVIIKCTKFGQLNLLLRKIIKIVAIRMMSDFKAKMRQIRFRLGRWGSLQRFPDLELDLRGYTSEGREGTGREWGEGREGRAKEKEKRDGGGRGNEGKAFPLL